MQLTHSLAETWPHVHWPSVGKCCAAHVQKRLTSGSGCSSTTQPPSLIYLIIEKHNHVTVTRSCYCDRRLRLHRLSPGQGSSAQVDLDHQIEIHVVDIINTNRNTHPGVTYHTCDITSLSGVEAVFHKAKPRTVFHIACPDSMVHQPDLFRRVIVDGAKHLLTASRQVRTVRAFVNTSTSSVIHDNVSDLINADDSLPVLQYPVQKRIYTLTKAEAEAEIIAANRVDDMLTVCLRPDTVFGERDSICMGKIVASCRAGRGRVQIGPGTNEYVRLHVHIELGRRPHSRRASTSQSVRQTCSSSRDPGRRTVSALWSPMTSVSCPGTSSGLSLRLLGSLLRRRISKSSQPGLPCSGRRSLSGLPGFELGAKNSHLLHGKLFV